MNDIRDKIFSTGTMSTEMELHDPFVIPDEMEITSGPLPRVVYAYEMRVAGVDWDTIASKVGYLNSDSARAAVMVHIKSKLNKDDVDEIVSYELNRLDKLQLICWAKAQQGDLKAVQQILNIMTLRMKFLGTEKRPNEGNTEITHNTAFFIGGSQEEYVSVLRQARNTAGVKAVIQGT